MIVNDIVMRYSTIKYSGRCWRIMDMNYFLDERYDLGGEGIGFK